MIIFYLRNRFLLKPFFLVVLIFASCAESFSADAEKLFKVNCSRCHSIGKGIVTGPDLKDVHTRVPSEQWLFNWIKNNKKMIAAGDAYAVKIYNEYNKQSMDVYEGVLTDEEINAIISYIKNPPPPPATANKGPDEEKSAAEEGISLFAVLLTSAITLLILVLVLGSVKRHLQDAVNAKKGLPPVQPVGCIKWVSQNKRLTALIVFVLGAVCARAVYIELMNIGVYHSYKPEQPIKFSHRIHADKLQINCVYCHSGAEKGRVAGIPSANVCMNCHKAIKEGPETGTTEIAKIYEAVGWDPTKGAYTKPEKPIKWIRVHNLPDFAYFNHSQHVVVGKQDCKNCHGDVAKMQEAEQVAPLTMGWCIDCHRKTEVPGMVSNAYYVQLHEKLKEKYKGEPITVEKMGGLDCIKCHY